MLYGIDISHYQKGIDLSKVKTSFVIAKATEGVNYTDPCFNTHMTKAKSLGKCLGCYHFAHPEKNTAKAEAQFFYKFVKNYVGSAILVLDWESSGKSNVAWAKEWLYEVYRLTGVKPLIYMSESVANAYDWSKVASGDYGLWVAKYRDNKPDKNHDMTNAGTKPNVKYWNVIAMWQWTSSGRLDGYNGNLDCDVFFGEAAVWQKYAQRKTKTYTVKAGDTLTGIAKSSGLSVDVIVSKNGLIKTGQVLKL